MSFTKIKLPNLQHLLLHAENAALSIGHADENGHEAARICSVHANGVTVYPNSAYSPEYMTKGRTVWARREGTRTPMENAGKTEAKKVRGTPALRLDQMPNIGAHAIEALQSLIDLWPSLPMATQNRIYAIAQAEAPTAARNASDKRGGK